MSFWKKDNSQEKTEEYFSEDNAQNSIGSFIASNTLDNTDAKETTSEDTKTNKPIVRSALSQGTVIQGKLSFDTPVSIDGKLSGELFSLETVIVGQSGMIDAQIEVRSLEIFGSVKGDIKVKEQLILHKGSSLNGSLITPSLIVEDGASLNCKCNMKKK